MMGKKISSNDTKNKELSFFQRLSPFNKIFSVQIIFLSIAIISAFLGLYYIFYQQTIDIFIHEGILPSNLNWMLYFIGGSSIILIGLLFAPLDESFFKKKEILDKIPSLKNEIEEKLREESYNEAIQIIETYFNDLISTHLYKKNKDLLFLYKQAQINKKLKNMLRKAVEFHNVNSLSDFRQQSQEIAQLIESSYDYILENQKKKFQEILNLSRIDN